MILLKRPALVACAIIFAGLLLLPQGTLRVLFHPDDYPVRILPDATIPAAPVAFTAAHITSSISGADSQAIELIDEQTRTQRVLMRRPFIRHCNFDLTPYLNASDTFTLKPEAVPAARSAKILIEEFQIRRCDALAFFPPLSSIFMGAFLVYAVGWLLGQRAITNRQIIVLITLIGFTVRWNALGASFGFPLEGDAPGYDQAAAALSCAHPFSTGLREPLYIWVLAIVKFIFGSNDLYVRMTTMFLSTAIVALTCAMIWQLSSNRLAMMAGGCLIALGDFSVFNSVRGERAELLVFLLLLYFVVLLRPPQNPKSEILLAIVGGLVGLTWLVGLIPVLLAYAYRWRQWRVPLPRVLLFLSVTLLILAPHFVEQWRATGDPLNALNAHVNFYKNAQETGVPSYAGTRTSWWSFLLAGGHIGELLKKTFGGYVDLFFNPTSAANHAFLGFHPSNNGSYWLFPFLLLGIGMDIRRHQSAALWLALATVNITVSFLAEIRDPRLFLQVAPWFAYFVGRGVQEFLGGVKRLVR